MNKANKDSVDKGYTWTPYIMMNNDVVEADWALYNIKSRYYKTTDFGSPLTFVEKLKNIINGIEDQH